MVFSALTFLHVFLPLCLFFAILTTKMRLISLSNAILLLFSLVFYAWGAGAEFVHVMILSIVGNFLFGILIQDATDQDNDRRKKIIIGACVALNLSVLFYFKYMNFFLEQVTELVGLGHLPVAVIVLPLGISFYTFHAISYTIDVSRGKARAQRDPLTFGLYMALFPQLVAGPIVRYSLIAHSLTSRDVTLDGFAMGARRFAHGLAKKVLIADSVAIVADYAFAVQSPDMATAWLGAVAYTLQIYFDFSGYSDMAIGLGLMLGFKFPENFNRPYSSLSITDFWRRWHITLSNWFRDYLYIPLGGSHRGGVRTLVNLTTVFFLTGIWHGAAWTFILWGVFHAVFLIGERFLGFRETDENQIRSSVYIVVRRAITLLVVILGWVLFRSPDIGHAIGLYGAMIGNNGIGTLSTLDGTIPLISILILMASSLIFFAPGAFNLPALYERRNFVGYAASATLMFVVFPLTLLRVASQSFSPFLYYQF